MGIEDWGAFEDASQDEATIEQIERQLDEPRHHTLGGFLPGRGFGPSEAESYEAPESLDFDETAELPFPDAVPATR
jgi:hypothetical protein